MEHFIQVFGRHLQMTYGCFDRIAINGFLPSLIRECNLVYLLRDIDGIEKITQEVLPGRTEDYHKWVEGYALGHEIPIEWAQKSVRKQDSMQRYQRKHLERDSKAPYYIIKSMEQGWTYRIAGALSGSLLLFKPSAAPQSDLEKAFNKVEDSIDSLLAILEAA